MTTLKAGTVVEVRPQGFVKGVLVVKGPQGDPGPKGDRGDAGPQGDPGPKGDKGDTGSTGLTGPANTLAVGTVTTSSPGGSADATVTGSAPNQTLNLTIPRGVQGPQGDPGPKGDPGTGNVDTVNGISGPNVVLAASDVHARPDTYVPDWTEVTGKPSTFAPSAHTHAQSDVTGLSAALGAKADLVAGVVPTSQMPAIAMTNAVPVANQAAMLALTTAQVQPGDVAVRADGAGTFMLVNADPSVLSNWTLLNAPTDKVSSVNSQIGTVVLGKTDIGLGNVDNTSDANKPVSTAQQTALNGKVDKPVAGDAAGTVPTKQSDGSVAWQVPSGSGTAISVRATGNGRVSGTSNAITLPAGIVAGDLILLPVTTNQVAPNTPAGYTLIASAANGTTQSLAIFAKVATAGDAGGSVTLASGSTSSKTWCALVLTGVTEITGSAAAVSTVSTGSTVATGTIAGSSTTRTVVIIGGITGSNATFTVSSGATQQTASSSVSPSQAVWTRAGTLLDSGDTITANSSNYLTAGYVLVK